MTKMQRVYVLLALSLALLIQFQNCGYPVELVPENSSLKLTSLGVPVEGEAVEFRIFIHNRENGVPEKFRYKISQGPFGKATDFVAHEGEILVDPNLTADEMSAEGILLTVESIDDNLYEGDSEGFVMEIIDDTRIFLPENLTLPVFLSENDGMPSITVNDAIAPEGQTLNFTATLSHPSAFPITINLDNFTGPELGVAFTPSGFSFLIDDERTSVDFTMLAEVDATFESKDEVGQFEILTNDAAIVVSSIVAFTITNTTEQPILNIADITVEEGEALEFELNVAASDGSPIVVDRDLTFNYSINLMGGLKPTDFRDINVLTGTVLIRANSVAPKIRLRTVDDNIDEDNESLELILSNLPAELSVIAGARYIGVINDNDTAKIELVDVAPVDEGAGTVNVTVQTDIPTALPITFKAKTINGPSVGGAVAGDDYNAIAESDAEQPFTIDANETSIASTTISINILEDNIYEDGAGDEVFTLEITQPTNPFANQPANVALNVNKNISILIKDNEAEPIITMIVPATVSESAGLVNVALTIDKVSSKDVSVNIATVELGTGENDATGSGVDYTSINQVVTFAAGETGPKNVLININNDANSEFDENFEVTLSSVSGASIGNVTETVTIQDSSPTPTIKLVPEDTLLVQMLSDSSFKLNEPNFSGKNIEFKLVRIGDTSKNIRVDIFTANGPAGNGGAVSGSDFTGKTINNLRIRPSEPFVIFDVFVKNDSTHELDEVFFIQLTDIVNADFEQGISTYGVTIAGNDAPTLTDFRLLDTSVTEGASHVAKITFDKELDLPIEFKVDATSIGGSAIANQDFVPQTEQVYVVPSGQSTFNFNVDTLIDNKVEASNTENYEIRAKSFRVQGGPGLAIAQQNIVATIEDADEADLGFAEIASKIALQLSSGAIMAGDVTGSIRINVDQSDPTVTTELPINFTLQSITAPTSIVSGVSLTQANAQDVQLQTLNGTIPAGASFVTIDVTMSQIKDSTPVECQEWRVAGFRLIDSLGSESDRSNIVLADERQVRLVESAQPVFFDDSEGFGSDDSNFTVTYNFVPASVTSKRDVRVEFTPQANVNFDTAQSNRKVKANINSISYQVNNINITGANPSVNFNLREDIDICVGGSTNYNSTSTVVEINP